MDLSNENVIDIKCGDNYTLILTSNQEVLSCGGNEFGQLGREVTPNANYSTSFQKIENLSEIIRIECGFYHTISIDTNNTLFVFGENKCGN